MSQKCCGPEMGDQSHNDPVWRRILWLALLINAAMFVVEMIAGLSADSRALQADALDCLGDAANYGVSLYVAAMALAWRSRAAVVKAATMLAFGFWVMGSAIFGAIAGASPEPGTMGVVGSLALAANIAVAAMLFRYRTGDANMRSVWICSRNDALSNLAVLAAALGVFGTGAAWPDLLVAAVMAGLAIWGSIEVFHQARAEMRTPMFRAQMEAANDGSEP
ncbi:MAG: cation transporter [Pacificimonas sp.]